MPTAPLQQTCQDQRELEKQNQEQARKIRRRERELQRDEKAIAEVETFRLIEKSRMPSGQKAMRVDCGRKSHEGLGTFGGGPKGWSTRKCHCGFAGLCLRSLRRWGQVFATQGFSKDRRKGSQRHVRHRFSDEKRKRLIETIDNPRFADLRPA